MLPKGSVSNLPRNLHLAFTVEMAGYNFRMKDISKVSCEACVSSSGPIVAFCTDCREFLCKRCTDYHRDTRRTMKHDLVEVGAKKTADFTKNIKPRDFYCTKPKHEGEVLKFYCETCQQLVCRDCILIEHKDHRHVNLSKVTKSHKDEMKSLLDPAGEAMATLDDAMGNCGKMIQQVQSRSKAVDASINQVFDRLKEALEERRKKLLAKSKEVCTSKVTALTLQQEDLQRQQQEIKMYANAIKDGLQTFSDEEVVTLGRLLPTELQNTLKRFRDTSLQLHESDAMPTSLEPAALLDSIAQFAGCSPAHSTASTHISRAIKGKEREFHIVTRYENGEPFDLGGEDVKAELCLMGSTDPPVRGETTDNGDGTYSVSITPQTTGEHQLMITIHNRPIKQSPFVVSVREPRDYTAMSSSPQQTLSNLGGYEVYSLAIHDNGDIYVTQPHYIRIVNPVDGSTRAQVGSNGSGKRQFNHPFGIALRGDYMYIADNSNNRIQKICATGNHEFISQFGKKGSGDGEFSWPRGICLDPEGRIFVSDHNNHRVQVLEPDGTFIYKIPQDNSDKAKVTNPLDLAFDHIGNLHVASYGTNTIKVFTPEGKFLEEYGQGKLSGPAGITIDEEGYVIVAEHGSSRVQIFSPDSHESIRTLTGFSYPYSVVSSKEGFIYVGDRNNSRILKY